jgi:tripartite ATP-independent transporter DctP family solute receptor
MPGRAQHRLTVIVLVGVTVLLAALTLQARRQTSDIIVLKLAHGLDPTHPVHISMEYMAKRLFEKSGGAIRIEIFPSEQLGSERECTEQVQLGSLDMTKSSTTALEPFIPEMGVFTLPYMFRDDEQYWKVLNGEIGKEILEAGVPVGLHGLCYFDAGSRSFYTTRPINSPADFRGMKIRVQQSATAMAMIDALGGAPTPIPFGELYTALQQGVVNGAENNPPSFLTSRHYEVAKYYELTQHAYVPDALLISEVVWRNLPPEGQRQLAEAAAEAGVFQRDLWAKKSAEAIETLKKAGVTVTHPDKQPFIDAVRPMLSAPKNPAVERLMQRILAL